MVILAVMLSMMAGTAAQATAATPATGGAGPASAGQVCRRPKSTGTRLRAPKDCRSRGEWEVIDAEARSRMLDVPIERPRR